MSVIVPGNFDCGKLLEIKAKVQEIWNKGIIDAEYIPDVEPAVAILQNQTAQLQVL